MASHASPELLGIIVAGINLAIYEGKKPVAVQLGLATYCDLLAICGLRQEDPPKIASVCGLPLGLLLEAGCEAVVRVLVLDSAKS